MADWSGTILVRSWYFQASFLAGNAVCCVSNRRNQNHLANIRLVTSEELGYSLVFGHRVLLLGDFRGCLVIVACGLG
jgi:hypothetical protein